LCGEQGTYSVMNYLELDDINQISTIRPFGKNQEVPYPLGLM